MTLNFFRFVTPQGMNIDLRLCNKELMSSVKPHLLHILNTAILDWIPERRKELMKQCRYGCDLWLSRIFFLSKTIFMYVFSMHFIFIFTDNKVLQMTKRCLTNWNKLLRKNILRESLNWSILIRELTGSAIFTKVLFRKRNNNFFSLYFLQNWW